MTKFSIVCPVKDEVDLIPKTVPSYFAINPDEVIFCLDKPAPKNVVETIMKIAEECKAKDKVKIVEVERNPEYRFHQAWVRRSGFREARNDIILTVDIDIILNPKIVEYLDLIGKDNIMLISFSKWGKPLTWQSLMAYYIQKILKRKSFTGLYAFSKKAWLETEDMESLKKIPRGEDTHLHKSITKKYNYKFISGIKNIVLRPKESPRYQYTLGWNRWKIRRTSLPRIILSSIIYWRPRMLKGYIDARFLKKKDIITDREQEMNKDEDLS